MALGLWLRRIGNHWCLYRCISRSSKALGLLADLHTRTSISHGKQERLCVLQLEILIIELGAIDTLSSGSIASSKVSALDHKLLDDTVKSAALVG